MPSPRFTETNAMPGAPNLRKHVHIHVHIHAHAHAHAHVEVHVHAHVNRFCGKLNNQQTKDGRGCRWGGRGMLRTQPYFHSNETVVFQMSLHSIKRALYFITRALGFINIHTLYFIHARTALHQKNPTFQQESSRNKWKRRAKAWPLCYHWWNKARSSIYIYTYW